MERLLSRARCSGLFVMDPFGIELEAAAEPGASSTTSHSDIRGLPLGVEPQDRAPSGDVRRLVSRVRRVAPSDRIVQPRVAPSRGLSLLPSSCSIESSMFRVQPQAVGAIAFGSIAAHKKPASSRPTATTILLCALPRAWSRV